MKIEQISQKRKHYYLIGWNTKATEHLHEHEDYGSINSKYVGKYGNLFKPKLLHTHKQQNFCKQKQK